MAGNVFRSKAFETPEELTGFVNDNVEKIHVVSITARDAGYIGYDLFYWELDVAVHPLVAGLIQLGVGGT